MLLEKTWIIWQIHMTRSMSKILLDQHYKLRMNLGKLKRKMASKYRRENCIKLQKYKIKKKNRFKKSKIN